MMKVIISRQKEFENLKNRIKSDGYKNLRVLSDFDRTLTYGVVDGVKIPSLISMLGDRKHLTPDYAEKAHALFNKYHPIEMNSSLPIQERKNAMVE